MKLVSSPNELNKFCSDVTKIAKYVAIDTEFVRHNTYYAKLCLIQLAFIDGKSKRILLLDPLVNNLNLDPLKELFNNRDIVKVIHASRQDLEIFLKLFDFLPIPLFDTQVAAMVCGKGEQESYENLVKKLLGKQVNKECQFTDWSKRPLSNEQIKYASEDVSYLCDLYEILKNELNDLGRSTWVTEEIEKLTDRTNYISKAKYSLRKIKGITGSIHFKNLVAAILEVRESIAQQLNLPRNQVIKDPLIQKLAKSSPKTVEELKELNIFSPKINESSYYPMVLDIFTQQRMTRETDLGTTSNPKINDYTINKINLLKVLLKMKSSELRVAPKLIATTKDLEIIARENNPDVPALKGWRKEIFGEDALKLKQGKIALSVGETAIRILQIEP